MNWKSWAIFLMGLSIGAGGMLVHLSGAGKYDALEASSTWRTPNLMVWYRSFKEGEDRYRNDFQFRKVCGDAQKPCSPWMQGASTHSDRPYRAGDIEFTEVGGSVLILCPDGNTIKGGLEEAWRVERAPGG